MKNSKHDFLIDGVHLALLSSFAFAQPLYDLLGRNAEFFVARRSEPVDVLLLVAGLSLLIPAIFLLIEGLAGLLGERIRKRTHYVLAGALVTIALLPLLKQLDALPGPTLVGAAAISGTAAALGYWRFKPFRSPFATGLIALGTLIFPFFFLLISPVSKVVFPKHTDVAASRAVAGEWASTPVIMVIFDELSSTALMNQHREIDPVRYPNFAALARKATWYRNATTVADSTAYAIPSILTGKYPDGKRLPTAADYPENLFTLLADTHGLNVFESITRLCPDELCESATIIPSLSERLSSLFWDVSIAYGHLLVPEDLTTALPTITATWGDFMPLESGEAGGGSRPENARDPLVQSELFINSLRRSPRPTLNYLHVLLPHGPWQYLPSGKRYGPLDASFAPHGLLPDGSWSDESWPVVQSFQRYLLQLGLADRILGRLIKKLKSIDLYDRSILIVTSDHGISFRAGDQWRKVTSTNYHDIMPILLLSKAPYQSNGEVDDRNIETIDILPTIMNLLDIRAPRLLDGQSALSSSYRERPEKVAFSKSASQRQSFEPRIEKKYEALTRAIRLFGSGRDSLFAIGPYSDLVGSRTTEIASTSTTQLKFELDGSRLWDNVDVDGAFLPVYITGTLFENVPDHALHLAVSVNGTIAAVTQTYRQNERTRFASMVPQESLIPGRNQIELFIVRAEGDAPSQLTKVQNRKAVSYHIAQATDELETIESSSGTTISIDNSALFARIQHARIEGKELEIRGWAADLKNFEVPERILVFLNGESFFSGETNQERPGLAKKYGVAVKKSGFRYRFPLQMFEDLDNSEIRIFSLTSNDVATELEYPVGYAWGRTYTLVIHNEDEKLLRSDGREIPVVPQAVSGTSISARVEKDRLIIAGWAIDAESTEIPSAIVVFVNGEFLHAGRTHIPRHNLVKGPKNETTRLAGYDFRIPVKLLEDVENDEIRVFAVSRRNVASELHRP